MFSNEVSRKDAKRRIYANGINILRAIIEHWECGGIDFPESNHLFMNLIASVAEGKVKGSLDEETGMTKWSLTDDCRKELEKYKLDMENVVIGPWRS